MSVYQNRQQCVLCELNSSYSVFHFVYFAYVLRMSWCACGLGILHFLFTSRTYQFWGSQMQLMGAFMSTPPPILFIFLCIPVLLFILYPPLKSSGYFGIPSVQKFALSVRPSVRLYDRPSVTISFLLSILSIFQPILFKFYIRVYIGEE